MSRYLSHIGFWLNGLRRVSALPYWGCGRLRLRAVRPLYGLWLPACADLAKGCAVSTFFMGISNCREIPCAAQSRRSTVNWLTAQRGVVGAAPQNRRESNHNETGKGDTLWGLNARWQATVNWLQYHGSLEPNRGTFQPWYFGPGTASATGQAK